MISYSLLRDFGTVMQGTIAELVAAQVLRRNFGFLVIKANDLVQELHENHFPENDKLHFFEKYSQTMDYVACYPFYEEMLLIDHVRAYFQTGGVAKFFVEEYPVKVFVIEVKSRTKQKTLPNFSPNQKKLFKQFKKLHLEVLIPIVTFEADYEVSVNFFDDKLQSLDMSQFLPQKDT